MQKELDALVREVLPLDRGTMTAAEEYQARQAPRQPRAAR